MARVDPRPEALDLPFRPGSAFTVHVIGDTPGWLTTRAFTATLNGTSLTVTENGDTLDIGVTAVVTAANASEGARYPFILHMTGGNDALIGTWVASMGAAPVTNVTAHVLVDDINVSATILAGVSGGGGGGGITDLTGDVTASGTGSVVATIPNDTVTNAKAANMAAHTIKGNNTGSTADPLDLTLAQVKSELNLTGTNSGDQTITLTGDVTGSGTGSFAATLASTISAGGPTGSATAVPVVTYDAKGRLTAVTTAATVGTVAATDASITVAGTATAPTISRAALTGDATASAGSNAVTLATVNSNTGTWGDSTHVPQFTVDGKGRITAVSSVVISGGGGGGLVDGDYGDVTVSGSGTVITIDAGVVSNAKAVTMAANTLKGNITGSTAAPTDNALAANQFLARSSTGDIAAKAVTDFGLSLIDDAAASNARTTLGLVIGTDVAAIASPAFTGNPTAPTQTAGNNSTRLATTAYADAAALAANLMPTALKTTAYSAVAFDFVPTDTTGGTFAVTLPTAPAQGTTIAVKWSAGAAAPTAVAGGSDVLNLAGGGTTATFSAVNQTLYFYYRSTGGIWYVTTSFSKSGLDSLYPQLVTATTKGDLYAATAASTVARLGVGTDGQVVTADAASTPGLKYTNIFAPWTVIGNMGSTETFTGITGQLVRYDATADTTTAITVTLSNDQQMEVLIRQDATGGRIPTWVTTTTWLTRNAVAPNLGFMAANATALFRFFKENGTVYGQWLDEPHAGRELFYGERNTDYTISASSLDMTSPIPEFVTGNIVGRGYPVQIESYWLSRDTGTANAIQYGWIAYTVNGGSNTLWCNYHNASPVTNAPRVGYIGTRMVLTAGSTYVFKAGVYRLSGSAAVISAVTAGQQAWMAVTER